MLWRCTVCGFVHEGDEAPDFCPKCRAPKEKFVEMTEQESKLKRMSDRTNDIHMEIINLSMRIVELSKEGIDLNLDPPCVALFKDAINEAWVIKERSKAEIAGHLGKGKW